MMHAPPTHVAGVPATAQHPAALFQCNTLIMLLLTPPARCVNRLAWSSDGTQLVSGSDDRSMRVWRYTGDGAQEPLVVDTLHQGNIFGVAFLPATDNRELVSGAMDYSGELCRREIHMYKV
jgi:WD40 repeat protein